MCSKLFSKNNIWTKLTFFSFFIIIAFIYWTSKNMRESGIANREIQKEQESLLAITSFKKELDKFALLVLGIRNQIETIDHVPDEKELQAFFLAQLKGVSFNESIVISYLDTNHIFQYSVTKDNTIANTLAGKSVRTIRDSAEINRLNNLLNSEDLLLFPPLNLVEGWAGIPLCFRLQKEGKTVGYFAPIIDFKSILDEIYQLPSAKNFVYKFSYNNELLFDRNLVYDNKKIYTDLKDSEFYQNFDYLADSDYYYNSFDRFGASFQIGVAHKEAFQLSSSQKLLLSSWYFIVFCIYAFVLFFSYWLKKRKLELKAKRDKLINYNEALEKFTFAASHDLKEPLRNIGSFSSLIKRRYQNMLDDKGKEYLDFIGVNVYRMNTLLEDLLQYAKLVNMKEVPKENITLDLIIKDVVESVRSLAKEHNAQITIDASFPNIYINKTQIHQLLQNLVSNAIKFNDKEECKVHIGSQIQNEQAVFFVKDNGIGINKEYQDKIFAPFQRLNTREFEGSGLGLAICKKIVEENGGRIWLDAVAGGGSVFWFCFE